MKKLLSIVLILAMILSLSACSDKGYEETLELYIEALNDQDAEALLELFPENVIEYMIDEGYGADEDELLVMAQAWMDMYIAECEDICGEDVEFTYEVLGKEKVSGSDLKDLKADYEDDLELKVKAGTTVEFDLIMEGDDDDDTEDMELVLVKIDGEWYLDLEHDMIESIASGEFGYYALVNQYMDARIRGDAEAELDLWHEDLKQYLIDEWYDDEESMLEIYQESADGRLENWEYYYGDNLKISYEIADLDWYDEDEIEDAIDEYESYDVDIKITQYVVVELDVTFRGDDDSDTDEWYVYLMEVGGKWYYSPIN